LRCLEPLNSTSGKINLIAGRHEESFLLEQEGLRNKQIKEVL